MFRRHKKSQGISINTIIIAAIALAVLVVLFVIFTGRFKIFSEGVDQTASCNNACAALGKTKFEGSISKETCQNTNQNTNELTYIPGRYSDVPQDFACCCKPKQ